MKDEHKRPPLLFSGGCKVHLQTARHDHGGASGAPDLRAALAEWFPRSEDRAATA